MSSRHQQNYGAGGDDTGVDSQNSKTNVRPPSPLSASPSSLSSSTTRRRHQHSFVSPSPRSLASSFSSSSSSVTPRPTSPSSSPYETSFSSECDDDFDHHDDDDASDIITDGSGDRRIMVCRFCPSRQQVRTDPRRKFVRRTPWTVSRLRLVVAVVASLMVVLTTVSVVMQQRQQQQQYQHIDQMKQVVPVGIGSNNLHRRRHRHRNRHRDDDEPGPTSSTPGSSLPPFTWDEIPLWETAVTGRCGVDKCFFESKSTPGVGYLIATQTTTSEGDMFVNLQRAYHFSRRVIEGTCGAQHLLHSQPFMARASPQILQRLNDLARNPDDKKHYVEQMRKKRKEKETGRDHDGDRANESGGGSNRTRRRRMRRPRHDQRTTDNTSLSRFDDQEAGAQEQRRRALRRHDNHRRGHQQQFQSQDTATTISSSVPSLSSSSVKPHELVYPMYDSKTGKYNPEYEWMVVQPVNVAPSPVLSFGVLTPKFQNSLVQIPSFKKLLGVPADVFRRRLARASNEIKCVMDHSPTRRYWYDLQGLVDTDGTFFHTDIDSQFWTMHEMPPSDDVVVTADKDDDENVDESKGDDGHGHRHREQSSHHKPRTNRYYEKLVLRMFHDMIERFSVDEG